MPSSALEISGGTVDAVAHVVLSEVIEAALRPHSADRDAARADTEKALRAPLDGQPRR